MTKTWGRHARGRAGWARPAHGVATPLRQRARRKAGGCVVLAVAVVLGGCAGVGAKFAPTTRVDLAPFADQTIALVLESFSAFQTEETIRIKRYLRQERAERAELEAKQRRASELFQAIVDYSVDMVTLSESTKTGPEQAAALSEYVRAFEERVLAQRDVPVRMGKEQFDEIAAKMREQETLLDALRTVQPIVNAAARYGGALLTAVEQRGVALAGAIETTIEAEYREIVEFNDNLKAEKKLVLEALQELYRHQRGEPRALERLRASPLARRAGYGVSALASAGELSALEQRLSARLGALREASDQLAPDLWEYHESKRELAELIERHRRVARRAHATLIVWARAHQKMASGVTDPAKWFDVTDPTGQVFNLLLRGAR